MHPLNMLETKQISTVEFYLKDEIGSKMKADSFGALQVGSRIRKGRETVPLAVFVPICLSLTSRSSFQ